MIILVLKKSGKRMRAMCLSRRGMAEKSVLKMI